MLFLGIKHALFSYVEEKCCFLSKNKVVFDNEHDTIPYYFNVITHKKDIINADYSALLTAYVLYQDCRNRFYQKRFLDEESVLYCITYATGRYFNYTLCYTYYIKNIKNLLKKNDNKNTFLNLLLEQYKYENTEKWVDFVRVSLIIEKLSYIASIFTLRKYGYVPNKDDYCDLFLLLEEIGDEEHIKRLTIDILHAAFINKTYDNATLFFLIRSLRNFTFTQVMDSDITNLEFSQKTYINFPFSTSEEIFDFGRLKIYIQKSVNFNIYSLQRGHFSEHNFIRVIKEKLVYNYDLSEAGKFGEATALLIAASMSRLSKLKLIESIFINLKGTKYTDTDPRPSSFRIQYRIESPEKEASSRVFDSLEWGPVSHDLGLYYPKYFTFFDYSQKEIELKPSKKSCRGYVSYIRIDVYESRIRYNDKTLYFILPIISYKCDTIPSSTGKIYDIKEIRKRLEEDDFIIFTKNIRDKENTKLDVSIVINDDDCPVGITVYYNLSLFKKEQKSFYLDEFLSI